jgi:hypothetical protein
MTYEQAFMCVWHSYIIVEPDFDSEEDDVLLELSPQRKELPHDE